MEEEKQLARLVYGLDPVTDLENQTDPAFAATDRKQFALFHARLVARVEDRLSSQFGACMALIEEKRAVPARDLAKAFLASPEYRGVREDLTEEDVTSPARFEMAFLSFVLRTQEGDADFLAEFGDVFLHELAL